MFNNYNIQIITKTINTITDIFEGVIEFESTHNNEGIIGIRIFDTEHGYHHVKSCTFEEAITDDKEAYDWIANTINEYEESRICLCGNEDLNIEPNIEPNGDLKCPYCTAKYILNDGKYEPEFLCECGCTSWQPVEDGSDLVKCNECGLGYEHDERNNTFTRVTFG